jgi:hypothetical protein
MKPCLIVVMVASLVIFCRPSLAQQECKAAVEANVEIAGEELSLADLLSPDVCPQLRSAAAMVHLGGVPLAGSARVLEADEVRTLFERLRARLGKDANSWRSVSVPERIVIRRAGSRASCPHIVESMIAAVRPTNPAPSDAAPNLFIDAPVGAAPSQALECGAAGRIPANAPLESTRTVWNAARASWEISARCIHASDCVPFLVRLRTGDSYSTAYSRLIARRAGVVPSSNRISLQPAEGTSLVRTGEKVTLVWEQDGLRVVVPAISLDAGDPGVEVRARLLSNGRVVRAIVVSAGLVRTAA